MRFHLFYYYNFFFFSDTNIAQKCYCSLSNNELAHVLYREKNYRKLCQKIGRKAICVRCAFSSMNGCGFGAVGCLLPTTMQCIAWDVLNLRANASDSSQSWPTIMFSAIVCVCVCAREYRRKGQIWLNVTVIFMVDCDRNRRWSRNTMICAIIHIWRINRFLQYPCQQPIFARKNSLHFAIYLLSNLSEIAWSLIHRIHVRIHVEHAKCHLMN